MELVGLEGRQTGQRCCILYYTKASSFKPSWPLVFRHLGQSTLEGVELCPVFFGERQSRGKGEGFVDVWFVLFMGCAGNNRAGREGMGTERLGMQRRWSNRRNVNT